MTKQQKKFKRENQETLTRIKLEYTLNEHGTITDPGKFEGEMYYVPYLWFEIMEDDNGPDGDEKIFNLESDDELKGLIPELKDVTMITLWEDNHGFVNSCVE